MTQASPDQDRNGDMHINIQCHKTHCETTHMGPSRVSATKWYNMKTLGSSSTKRDYANALGGADLRKDSRMQRPHKLVENANHAYISIVGLVVWPAR